MSHSKTSSVRLVSQTVFSEFLDREVRVDYYLPHVPWWKFWERPYVLLFHDGQDLERMNFAQLYRKTFARRSGRRPLVVAVHANDRRLREYGTAAGPDYAQRGDLAHQHERFVLEELLPPVRAAHRTFGRCAVAGCSLGGLAAFDLAWRNPEVFDRVGVFSGALWWRSRVFRPEAPDADLMVHDMVRRTPAVRRGMRFWFQTGTLDEESDRNRNGTIDSIDDTLHLIACLQEKGYRTGEEITYVEIEGGRHDVPTWASILPEFLRWL